MAMHMPNKAIPNNAVSHPCRRRWWSCVFSTTCSFKAINQLFVSLRSKETDASHIKDLIPDMELASVFHTLVLIDRKDNSNRKPEIRCKRYARETPHSERSMICTSASNTKAFTERGLELPKVRSGSKHVQFLIG